MKTKIKLLKAYSATITWLLAVFGFSAVLGTSCAKYGCPAEEFELTGKVSSKATQQPLQNIRVVSDFDTTFTNIEGIFQVRTYSHFAQFHDTTGNYKDLDTMINSQPFNVSLTPNTQQNHEDEN